MLKVMYNDQLVYNVYIWALCGIIFGIEQDALSLTCAAHGFLVVCALCINNSLFK